MSKHASTRGLPIGGHWHDTADGWHWTARNPATGEPLWEVPDAGVPDARIAVEAAWTACHGTTWSTDDDLRRDALRDLQKTVADHADDLALLLAVETGVPVALREEHVDAPIRAMRPHVREAPAVTAVVTPSTAPLAPALTEIGRVLAGGGTVVLKPAPETASAALELGRIGLEVLPRGVLNVVTTRDVDVVVEMLRDPRLDAVSFTGSAVVGERVRQVAESSRTRAHLDLGGPRQLRVGRDGDLEAAVAEAVRGVAANAGQGCHLPTSVVVPVSRYTEALRLAIDAMEQVVVGDPSDPETLCGPLRSVPALDRVRRYLDLARSEGGDVVLGGRQMDGRGWWWAPTVVGGLSERSRLVREELLGPVLMVVAESSARA